MIMNQPTIFGYNAKSNHFLAGGEAGSETVVGTQSLGLLEVTPQVRTQLQPEVQQALETVQVGQRKQPHMKVVLLKNIQLTVRLLYVGEEKKTFGATFGNLSMVSIFGAMEKWAVVSLIFVLISVLQNQRTVETMSLPGLQ